MTEFGNGSSTASNAVLNPGTSYSSASSCYSSDDGTTVVGLSDLEASKCDYLCKKEGLEGPVVSGVYITVSINAALWPLNYVLLAAVEKSPVKAPGLASSALSLGT